MFEDNETMSEFNSKLQDLGNTIRRVNSTLANDEPMGTHWTRKGANLGVAAAIEVQRRTRNPVLAAAAVLVGSIGAFFGSIKDTRELEDAEARYYQEKYNRY